jgi:Serine dehydrogenase proteinase
MTCVRTSSSTHPEGCVLAVLQIAPAIRGHKAKITVPIPHYAMSGGTPIALIVLDISPGDAPQLLALAVAALSLGGVYWLVRDQDRWERE